MESELRKWCIQSARYFADPGELQPPVRPEITRPLARSRTLCFSCFEEGHEAFCCPQSCTACSCCGGVGHKADDCPLYFMELSIKGSFSTYLKQRADAAAARAADKGRFPALTRDCILNKEQSTTDKNTCELPFKANTEASSFAAVQCVLCGKPGHANCGPPPMVHRASYCPRCCDLGHGVAGCMRSVGLNKASLSNQDASDYCWARAPRRREGFKGHRSSIVQGFKPKPVMGTQMHAKSATGSPWHRLHPR